MKSNTLKLILLFLALLGLTSCAPSYHFKVDAIAGAAVQTDGSFYLISSDEEMDENDLRFEEASRYIQTALERKGFHKARDLSSADTLIVVSFGIGDPLEVVNVRSSYAIDWRSDSTTGIRVPVYDDNGTMLGYSILMVERPSLNDSPLPDRMERTTVFEKFLKLEAYDNRLAASSQELKRLWSIGIASADQSDDIVEYLPSMLAVALPYIGEETGNQISVELKPNDPMIEFIRSSEAMDTPSEDTENLD